MTDAPLQPRAITNDYWPEACPFCGGENLVRIGNISYASPTLFSTAQIAVSLTPELWECRHCRSKFTRNAVSERDAVDLYSMGSSGERWKAIQFADQQRSEVVRSLERNLRQGDMVIDVGCNTGEFLDFAASQGCKTGGVEFSKDSRVVAAAKGHLMYSDIEEIVDGSVDVVTAFDLVEHLYRPAAFMGACHRKLKPGGKLLIVTGDPHCMAARLYGAKWWYAGFPEHIVFPSRRYFAGCTPFRLDRVIATYASKASKLSLWQVLRSMIYGFLNGNTAVPQLGPDHMLVVLQKII